MLELQDICSNMHTQERGGEGGGNVPENSKWFSGSKFGFFLSIFFLIFLAKTLKYRDKKKGLFVLNTSETNGALTAGSPHPPTPPPDASTSAAFASYASDRQL